VVVVDQMKCASCDAELTLNATEPCPHCGSAARIRLVELNDSVGVHDGFDLAARHGEPGQVKPFREISDRVKRTHDRDRDERRRLVVDRDQSYYLQEWTDLDTGEVTWRKEGALDDPMMHGDSARQGQEARGPRPHYTGELSRATGA
jgi:hypothetical protein